MRVLLTVVWLLNCLILIGFMVRNCVIVTHRLEQLLDLVRPDSSADHHHCISQARYDPSHPSRIHLTLSFHGCHHGAETSRTRSKALRLSTDSEGVCEVIL